MNDSTVSTTAAVIYDGRSNFTPVLSYIYRVFSWYVNSMDSIFILGNFSMLDFSIAILLMGAILPLVIKTTANYSAFGDSAAINRSNAAKRRELAASRRKK